MNEQVISRERIARQADEAARQTVRTGLTVPNPYTSGTEAASAWEASYRRYIIAHASTSDTEGSA